MLFVAFGEKWNIESIPFHRDLKGVVVSRMLYCSANFHMANMANKCVRRLFGRESREIDQGE